MQCGVSALRQGLSPPRLLCVLQYVTRPGCLFNCQERSSMSAVFFAPSVILNRKPLLPTGLRYPEFQARLCRLHLRGLVQVTHLSDHSVSSSVNQMGDTLSPWVVGSR